MKAAASSSPIRRRCPRSRLMRGYQTQCRPPLTPHPPARPKPLRRGEGPSPSATPSPYRRGGSRPPVGDILMLTVESLDLHYGAAQALRGVNLTAEPGKVTCVLGRNGVGKTSLLRAIVGQQPISGGAHPLRRRAAHRLALDPGARRHRLRAAGPRDLSAAHGAGESRDRLRAAAAQGQDDSRRRLRSCSRC